MEHAMVHLYVEKRKEDETQAAMAGQVVLWRHELEKKVLRSTRCAHERNELKKRLAAKEKDVEAAVDEATNDGYFLASLHAAREAPTDFDLSQIHGWDREHILAIAEELEAKAAALTPTPAPADDITSSNGPSKGEAGAIEKRGMKEMEQKAGEEKAGENLNGAKTTAVEQDQGQ